MATFLVAAGAFAQRSSAAIPGIPSIYVNYLSDCTFTLSVDGGISVTGSVPPGPILPPGTYQVLVSMPNPPGGYIPCVTPVFALSGPGVSLTSTFPG